MADEHTSPWIEQPSAAAVARAVRAAVPELAAERIELNVPLQQDNPRWHGGTAWLGDTHVVKFAWSPEAAAELARERRVMLALTRTQFARWMPPIEATSEQPLAIVTRRVDGVPCWGEVLDDVGVARDVAAALADIHDPAVRAAIDDERVELAPPMPQGATEAIRTGLSRFLQPEHVPLVRWWCDWTDLVQSRPRGDRVVVHGDLHGFNLLVVDRRVRCVLDYDAVAVGDHNFDFRYLPGIDSRIGFLVAVVDEYERLTGRAVDPAAVLAWHIRTVLGDALWRSEAGVELPGGGTVHNWIEQLEARIAGMAAWRAFDAP